MKDHKKPDSLTLTDLLEESASRYPARPFLLAAGGTMSYAECSRQVAGLAGRLAACGVYFAGRTKDTIRRRGENIDPSALSALPPP